jgi:hypothetical protein
VIIDADYLVALIRHRVPELDAGSPSLIEAALKGETAPLQVMRQMIEAIDLMQERINALAEGVETRRAA